MKKVLVTLLDENHIPEYISQKHFIFDEIIVFMTPKYHDRVVFMNLKNRLDPMVPIKDVCIESTKDIKDTLDQYDTECIYILKDGQSTYESTWMTQIATLRNYKMLFVNEIDSSIIIMTNEGNTEENTDDVNIKVDTYVNLSGGKILSDSSEDFNSALIRKISKWILENYPKWEIIRDGLKKTIVYRKENFTFMDLTKLSAVEYKEVTHMFTEFKTRKYCDFNIKAKVIKFKKINQVFIDYFSKVGNWLEAITLITIKDHLPTSDVKSGVEFLWNKEDINNHMSTQVKNEIDLIAVRGQNLICISCKDMYHVKNSYLEELVINATALGGEDAVKILVLAIKPDKRNFENRAKELGISIVVFDGNIKKFSSALCKAINCA